jgi:large subunit ribosomal protein L4e
MFGPTKIWRKWHKRINLNQKRYAVASALAASALTALVQARGHRIEGIAEVPLVVDSSFEKLQRTKQAVTALKSLGAYEDVEKARDSRKLRAGVGKQRNRRHVNRRGPLIVYNKDDGIVRAVRNLPGVDVAQVERLNLLQLAPGGHLGRFVIWTRDAFEKLNNVWGSVRRESTQKKGWTVPRARVFNSDITRIINSDEVQSKVRPARKVIRRAVIKKNPLTNLGARVKLNPYALALRRSELLAQERRTARKNAILADRRAGKATDRTLAEAQALAAARTHDAQQKVNFAKVLSDGFNGAPAKLKVRSAKAYIKRGKATA